MSMSAADFTVLYTQPNNREVFDAVTTVFFIVTGVTVIEMPQ
jgi:carnosine N-methyltransferase